MEVGLDSLIGTKIAGYRIERLLGRGGMSAVYLAYDPGLDRRVALKLMSPELSEDASFQERFRVEWRRAASIEHPNVVPVYDAGEADGQLYIAMRYIEGTDLKGLLEAEGALEPERALNLLSQIAEGLDTAHDRGLVHRDVKPSNVLIARERDKEHAYLADFGLTKPASTPEEARESIQLSGTTDYVSPEQIADGTADASSDIYALGALLYESLTGEVPYPRERKLAVLFAHVNDPPPKPTEVKPELPEAIDGVVAKAMAKEPGDRYRTGAELAEAAAAAFPTPRRPWWQLAALVGVLALLIAAAITVPAILLTGRSGESGAGGTTEITTTSIQRIDPETGALAATLELDFIPEDLAAGGAGVWLLNKRDRKLVNLDPGMNTVAEIVDLSDAEGDRQPSTIEVSNDAVFTNFLGSGASSGASIWSYEPSSGASSEVASTEAFYFSGTFVNEPDRVWFLEYYGIAAEDPQDSPPEGPAEGALDDGHRDLLVQFASDTGQRLTVVDLHAEAISSTNAAAMAIDEQSLWVLGSVFRPDGFEILGGQPFLSGPENATKDPSFQALWEIDRETKALVGVTEIEMRTSPNSITIGGGFIWLPAEDGDTVLQFDPSTKRVLGGVRVGRQPTGAVWAGEAIWVANERDATVSRIDPETLDVETIDVGGTPTHIAANEDGVWVRVRPR